MMLNGRHQLTDMLPKIQLSCLMTAIFFWTAQAVIIDNCNNHRQVVVVNTPVVLSCKELPEEDVNYWCDANMRTIAKCSSMGNCKNYTHLDYQFIRNSTWSQLVIPQGLNRSYPSQTFTCMAKGSKYTCQLVIEKIPSLPSLEKNDWKVKRTFLGHLETFKLACIVVASGIAAGLLVIGIIMLIKRKGNIYQKPSRLNLDEHPYTIVFTGQHINTSRASVQENELRPFYVNVCRDGNPRS